LCSDFFSFRAFFSYDSTAALGLSGEGEGTIDDDLLPHLIVFFCSFLHSSLPFLQPEVAGYALVRKTETIDESETVKFVYLVWMGENIDRRLRSQLSTFAGQVFASFPLCSVVLSSLFCF
jgi:hypothetical protein